MYLGGGVCAHVCGYPQRLEASELSKDGLIGGHKIDNMKARNWTPVPYNSSALSFVSDPHPFPLPLPYNYRNEIRGKLPMTSETWMAVPMALPRSGLTCSKFYTLVWMKSCWSVSSVSPNVPARSPLAHCPVLPDVLPPCCEMISYSSIERSHRTGVHLGNSVDWCCFPELLCLIGSWHTVSEWCGTWLIMSSRDQERRQSG